jgi:hypothetical protein
VRTWFHVSALIAIGVVSRLPQLLSPNLLLDGDECILGLMAKHVSEGRGFPLFFYGQPYGLAVIEAPLAALNFLAFGVGVLPLKTAILALWLAGVVFYFLAFAEPLGHARSFCLTLLLLLMPAWAVSSMKAWSGYVTAFAMLGVLLYLLTRPGGPRALSWLVAGGITSVIYFAQPLYLPGAIPIVLFYLVSTRRLPPALLYASGAISMFALITALPTSGVTTWTPPTPGNPELLASWPDVLRQTYVNLTGAYFLRSPVEPGPVTAVAASLWVAVLAAALPLQIYRLLSRRYLLWSHLLFAGVLSTLLANWLLLEARDGRYMLPLNALLVFLGGVELSDLADRARVPGRNRVAALVLVLALEAVAMNEFARFTYMWWKNDRNDRSEAARLEAVIDHLKANGVRHALSTNALLQWQLMFYSREEIIARWTSPRDRYPPYITEVDTAVNDGKKLGVVGYVGYTGGFERLVPDPQAIVDIDNRYFVYIGADKELLRKAQFRFWD